MKCIAIQDPMCMGFPRQEYWSGLPFSFLFSIQGQSQEWFRKLIPTWVSELHIRLLLFPISCESDLVKTDKECKVMCVFYRRVDDFFKKIEASILLLVSIDFANGFQGRYILIESTVILEWLF